MSQSRGDEGGKIDNQSPKTSAPENAPSNESQIIALEDYVLEEQRRAEMLLPVEEHWRDRYELLLDHGYRLRSRLSPGWVPSWRDTKLYPGHFEDGYKHWTRQVIDATRVEDNEVVIIKEVHKLHKFIELNAMKYLSPDLHNMDPTNHCAPALDHFSDDRDENYNFIVMPLYRKFDDPEFYAVGEVIEFVRQTLEGLQYMHDRNVSHRDLASPNIMMDGRSLYPKGFHPSAQHMLPSCKEQAIHLRRIHAPPVKYVFVDLGIALVIPEGEERVTIGNLGREPAPEQEDPEATYDPFPMDIYVLGKVYEKKLLEKYTNIGFLRPLVDRMTQTDPSKRPTIHEAIEQLNKIRKRLVFLTLRRRLHTADETLPWRLARDSLTIVLDAKCFVARTVSLANPSRLFTRKRTNTQ